MKLYTVLVPFSGKAYVTVEADGEKEAKRAASRKVALHIHFTSNSSDVEIDEDSGVDGKFSEVVEVGE